MKLFDILIILAIIDILVLFLLVNISGYNIFIFNSYYESDKTEESDVDETDGSSGPGENNRFENEEECRTYIKDELIPNIKDNIAPLRFLYRQINNFQYDWKDDLEQELLKLCGTVDSVEDQQGKEMLYSDRNNFESLNAIAISREIIAALNRNSNVKKIELDNAISNVADNLGIDVAELTKN